MSPVVPLAVCLALVAAAPRAFADEDDAADAEGSAPFRLSLGAGGAALLSADDGETWRGLFAIDVYPGGPFGRFGASVALRSLLYDPYTAGLVTAGITYEAAAARPRLVMALHGEGGVTFGRDDGETRPAIGGGLKTHLGIIGPLAIATDVTAHLIAQDVDDLRLMVSLGAMITLVR